MGKTSPPTAHAQQSASKMRAKMQRKWTLVVRDYNKFTAMRDGFHKLPAKRLTEEMVALKAAINEHFAAPELIEAFERVYAVHPDWEMPGWVLTKMSIQIDESEQDVPEQDGMNEVNAKK